MIDNYSEDRYFRYIWKPEGIPSTFGKEKSFLDYFTESQNKTIQEIFSYQENMFGKEREYGLVNRLDNDTAGFLYFAKTPLFYEQYKHLQSENKLQKIYIADVSGQRISNKILQQPGISGDEKTICIQRKIAHHRYDQTKMIVLPDEKFISKYQQKIRGERTTQSTRVQLMYYDEQTNTSYLKIIIHKGIRHQIRAHLASVGYPIIGDSIYNKKNPEENLHLRSLGLYI